MYSAAEATVTSSPSPSCASADSVRHMLSPDVPAVFKRALYLSMFEAFPMPKNCTSFDKMAPAASAMLSLSANSGISSSLK